MVTKNSGKILALAISAALGSVSAQAADSELLDTLLKNGAINQTQYKELSDKEAVAAKEEAKDWTNNVKVKMDSKGFRVESADKAFKFQMGGRIQLDTHFSANGRDFLTEADGHSPHEGFEVRRARLYAKGTLWTDFKYKAQFDFAENKLGIKDMFVQYKGLQWVDITVGNQKQAMSMELQESSNDIMFTERSLITSLTDQFDRALGVRLSSKAKNWSAQFGAYGAPLGKTSDSSTTGGWGLSSRVTYAPILSKTHALHLGASVGYRGNTSAGTDTAQFKYETQHMSSMYFTDTGKVGNVSGTTLMDVEAGYIFGPFSMQAEYAHNWVARTGGDSDLDFQAYYVQAAWTITGESRSYKGSNGKFGRLKPENEFSWSKGTWGAWELATRFDGNDLNSGSVTGGEETAVTLAMNWYLNRNIRVMADYRYAFDVKDAQVIYSDVNATGTPDSGVHAFTLRTQLTF